MLDNNQSDAADDKTGTTWRLLLKTIIAASSSPTPSTHPVAAPACGPVTCISAAPLQDMQMLDTSSRYVTYSFFRSVKTSWHAFDTFNMHLTVEQRVGNICWTPSIHSSIRPLSVTHFSSSGSRGPAGAPTLLFISCMTLDIFTQTYKY